MPETAVSLQIDGRVARLTLLRNRIDGRIVRELAKACYAVEADEGVRVVLLKAAGSAFCEGWDWEAFAAAEGGLLEGVRAQHIGTDPFRSLAELPRPVVCAINGDAAGAGLELALACDVRIAAEDARLSLPEVSMGLLPLGGGIQRLARLVGRGRALEMLLTGEPVGAAGALAMGLVSVVAPCSRLTAEAEAVAARISERGPLAVRLAKEAVARGIDMPLEQALRFETDLTIILQTTEDRDEGVRAFLEKRKPDFKGR